MSIEGIEAAVVGGRRPVTRTRSIVKAREVAGSLVVTLPVQVRREAGIQVGDRVCVAVEGSGRVTITKE